MLRLFLPVFLVVLTLQPAMSEEAGQLPLKLKFFMSKLSDVSAYGTK